MACRNPYTWPGFGIICSLLSSFIFTINILIAKKIKRIHPCEIAFARCIIQCLITLPMMTFKWYQGQIDIIGPENKRLFLILRGITGSSTMICLYVSVGKIPVGDAVTISFTNTMYVSLIACVIFGEAFTILDGICIVLSSSGIILIAQPPFIFGGSTVNYSENLTGILFAIATSVLAAVTFNFIRKLGRETHFLLNVFSYSVCGTISTMLFLYTFDLFTWPCLREINLLILVGITGFCAQVFLTVALHVERAGTVSLLKSTQIIMTFIFQIILFGEIPSALKAVGVILICSMSLMVGVRKIYNFKMKKDKQQDKHDDTKSLSKHSE